MRTYKLTLEYDGSPFSGWQDQTNARTVQGELRAAAAALFQTEVDVQGSGRTDAGVHAVGQVAHLKMRSAPRLSPKAIKEELNRMLPASIAILDCQEAPPRFHARHDAVSRSYFYQISKRKAALSKRYVWWVKQPLNVMKMQQAAQLIVGRHDFSAFRALDKSKPGESTIVVVESAEVGTDEDLIVFRIEASHYLWRMVRRLAGMLVKVGTGEVSVAQFQQLIETGSASGEGKKGKPITAAEIAEWTAPAAGLFLESVRY